MHGSMSCNFTLLNLYKMIVRAGLKGLRFRILHSDQDKNQKHLCANLNPLPLSK